MLFDQTQGRPGALQTVQNSSLRVGYVLYFYNGNVLKD